MTKTEIANKFSNNLCKWGYDVKNFQSPRYNPPGSKGFTDLHITSPHDFVIYVEIKTKNDKPSDKQKEFREMINKHCTRAVHVYATEENTDRLISAIMQKQYQSLLEFEKPKKLSRISK